MKQKTKFNIQNLKFLILVFLFLIFFYFLIFKNILNYLELKEYISSEEIKRQRLGLEKEELDRALILKEKELEEKLKKFQKNENQEDKEAFLNISEAFKEINMYMNKNKILFESFGRSQKDTDNTSVSLAFSASEKDVLNFFKDLESSKYYFNLSNHYFKIEQKASMLSIRITLQFRLEEQFEKNLINNNSYMNNNNLFEKINTTDKNTSYMRIGNDIFYKKIPNKQEQTLENKEGE